MEYISIHEISKKWNIKERKITALCRENRIAGARKIGKNWMVPSNAMIPLDKRTKEYSDLEKEPSSISYSSSGDKVVSSYTSLYNKKPMYVSFTPYRICPIGAHVDHNLGKITGFAIDKGIHIAYSVKQNGIIELNSLQFPKRSQWHILNTPSSIQGDWADPLRGATIELSNRYPLRIGMSAVIDGELPIGGLSSSSSLIITFINSLAFINDIKLSKEELIEISEFAENKYLGIENGKLDQSCEVYSKKDKLLYVDMKDGSYKLIDTPSNMKPYVIGIFFSGLDKGLEPSKYNIRTDELRSAAYLLKALSGMEYGKFADTNMRDISFETFEKYKDKLPESYRKRVTHWFTENERVEKGIKLYAKGDIESFGKLINESGESSINNWETGSKELIELFHIVKNCSGVYGARFSGSGFKGCVISLIDPSKINNIMDEVKDKYLSLYPEYKDKYSAHICNSADGVKL